MKKWSALLIKWLVDEFVTMEIVSFMQRFLEFPLPKRGASAPYRHLLPPID